MTAAEILKSGIELLGPEPEKGFRDLMRQWHPDRCKDSAADVVVAHLLRLRDKAAGKQEEFSVPLPSFTLRLGRDEIVAPEPASGYGNLCSRLQNSKRLLPWGGTAFPRPPDSFPLVEVLRRRGSLPTQHVAWMASRLYELVWEADRAEWMVGGLYLEGLLVLAEAHGLIPLDLRFMARTRTRMEMAPAAMLPLVPTDRRASALFDLACANRVALRLLGDASGTGNALLTRAKKEPTLLPQRFLDWFRRPPTGAVEDYYRAYRALLQEIFGKPKYHKLEV